MPRRIRSRMAASELQAGPMVQTILARRGEDTASAMVAGVGFNLSPVKNRDVFRLQHRREIARDGEDEAFLTFRACLKSAPQMARRRTGETGLNQTQGLKP